MATQGLATLFLKMNYTFRTRWAFMQARNNMESRYGYPTVVKNYFSLRNPPRLPHPAITWMLNNRVPFSMIINLVSLRWFNGLRTNRYFNSLRAMRTYRTSTRAISSASFRPRNTLN